MSNVGRNPGSLAHDDLSWEIQELTGSLSRRLFNISRDAEPTRRLCSTEPYIATAGQ